MLRETFVDSSQNENIEDINNFFDYLLNNTNSLDNIRKCADKLRQTQANKKQQTELESYLLVVVEHIGSKSNQFRLTAELIKDYCNCPDERMNIKINEEDQLTSSYNELPQKISELITKAESYLWGTIYKLTIELFLPFDYLGEDFDIKITYSHKLKKVRPLGEKYRLIIRCLDRYDAYYLSNLLQRWNRKKCLCYDDHTNYLVELECLDELIKNCEDLANEWNRQEKIGVKLLCQFPPKNSKLRKAFFYSILQGGVLFALWSRKEKIEDGGLKDCINSLVSWHCIENFNKLRDQVLERRQNAHSKGRDAHLYLGYHLGILCENPERVPLYLKSNQSQLGMN